MLVVLSFNLHIFEEIIQLPKTWGLVKSFSYSLINGVTFDSILYNGRALQSCIHTTADLVQNIFTLHLLEE